MYNSKDMCVDSELTFLSFNQTVNCEFRVDELLESDLWVTNNDNGLIKAIPLFNCDLIISSNLSDRVLDDNKCIILQDIGETVIQCVSNDTGNIHYYTIELYAYAPYLKLDYLEELSVYVILYDEYLNRVNNVMVNVYIDNVLTNQVQTNNQGIARYTITEPCEIYFEYNENISNVITIQGD